MILTALGLASLAVVLIVPTTYALARAQWTVREPRAALVLWQAVEFAAGLAGVGALLALALALHPALLVIALGLLAWLLGVTARSALVMWRVRRRHRELLDLVSSPLGNHARVIDHPAAAAYCLPGLEARVVLTSGVLSLLNDQEVAAILAHEKAHLAERHDLVILPFVAWVAALPGLPGPRVARQSVAELVEMVADDRACAGRDRSVLATALARVAIASGESAVPAGALALGGCDVVRRVHRLLSPPMRSRWHQLTAYLGAAVVLALPALALFVALIPAS